jgi:zinc D-Ala-D-Ala dipeptidase
MNSNKIKTLLVVLFLTIIHTSAAQDTVLNKYGLWVIKDIKIYQVSITNKTNKVLVNLKKTIPTLILDLKYKRTDNFTKQRLYPATNATYLRHKAALALAAVQKELKTQHLGLKIFDAYRPYSITEKMWELVKDERYAADPKKGSGHNRGIAVDLTLIDLKTGKELNMGTGFDDFTDAAHHDFMALPKEVLQNRLLLKNMMEANGFKALETEWWHYALPDAKEYELLDLSFEDLKKKQ